MLQILFRWLELKIEIRRRLECVFYLILFSKKMEKWEKIGIFSLVGHPRFYWSLVSKPVPQDIQSICYCLHPGIFHLDTRDLLVAVVPISISSKYLYLYLALKVLTGFVHDPHSLQNLLLRLRYWKYDRGPTLYFAKFPRVLANPSGSTRDTWPAAVPFLSFHAVFGKNFAK